MVEFVGAITLIVLAIVVSGSVISVLLPSLLFIAIACCIWGVNKRDTKGRS